MICERTCVKKVNDEEIRKFALYIEKEINKSE